MGLQEIALVIAIIIIFILLVRILDLCSKFKIMKYENVCLSRNIENLIKLNDSYCNEIKRILWNSQIQGKTKYKREYKPNKKVKALVGDYMQSTLLNTNSILKSLGIETEVVPSGEDILERIKNSKSGEFDVIITNNIYKGHLDGPHTLRALKKIPKFKIPVIVLTVSQDERDYFIKRCGFDEYMTKVLTQRKAMKGLSSVIKNLKFKSIK